MGKGTKKGNGGQKAKNPVKIVKKPQTIDARKHKNNVNHIAEDTTLSWTSEEEANEEECDEVVENMASRMDTASFVATRETTNSWIASIRTPIRSAVSQVNPSPHPMQQLVCNPGTHNNENWRQSLFNHIREEGLDLSQNQMIQNNSGMNIFQITLEDVQTEIDYWKFAVVCYNVGVKPLFRIFDGFIRRMWGTFGVEKVVMRDKRVFMVRFRSEGEKVKAMEASPIFYDGKPVIMKEWTPDLDVLAEDIFCCTYQD